MTEIITYRLTGSGVRGYEFSDPERSRIGFVRNGLFPVEPVLLTEAESTGTASSAWTIWIVPAL